MPRYHQHWQQSPPPVHTHHPPAEYSYTTAPRSPRYHVPPSPQYSQFPHEYYNVQDHPQHFHQYAESQPPLSPHLGYDSYIAPHPHEYANTRHASVPDLSGLNLGKRSPSPQYVGRRSRSRASSKASSSAKMATRALPRRVMAAAMPPGYKPPTVETAPNSPVLLPSLSSDAGTLFEVDPDYIPPSPPPLPRTPLRNPISASQEAAEQDRHKKRPPTHSFSPQMGLRLERERTPYASSSTTASTAASSPPPEKLPLERERRQYSSRPERSYSDAIPPREPQPYADSNRSNVPNRDQPQNMDKQSYTIPQPESESYSDHQSFSEAVPKQEPQPYGDAVPPREPQPYSNSQTNPEAIPNREPQPYGDSAHSQESQPYSGYRSYPEVVPQRQPQSYSDHQTYSAAIPQREPQPYGGTVPSQEQQPYSDHQPYSEAISQSEYQSYGDVAPLQDSEPYPDHQAYSETMPQRHPQPYTESQTYTEEIAQRQSDSYSGQGYPEPAPQREPQSYADSVPSHDPHFYTSPHEPLSYHESPKSEGYARPIHTHEPQPYEDQTSPEQYHYDHSDSVQTSQTRDSPHYFQDHRDYPIPSAPSDSYPYTDHQGYASQGSPYPDIRDPQQCVNTAHPRDPQPYAYSSPTMSNRRSPSVYTSSSAQHDYPGENVRPPKRTKTPKVPPKPAPYRPKTPAAQPPIQTEAPYRPKTPGPSSSSQSQAPHRPKTPGSSPSEEQAPYRPKTPGPPPIQTQAPYRSKTPGLPSSQSQAPHRPKTPGPLPSQGQAPYRPKTPGPPQNQTPPPQPQQFISIEPDPAQSLVRRPASPEPESEFLELVPVCPKRSMVTRGHWYAVPSIPGYHICERCYEVHIYKTQFRNNFEETTLAPGEWSYCAFNTPRVLKVVWPETLYHGEFDIFEGYAMQRSKLPTCGLAARSTRGLWYTIQTSLVQTGFIACQACYEDVILASPYHEYFTRLDAANPGGLLSCHLSSAPFIEAQMVDDETTWPQFCRQVDYRLKEVPPCPQDQIMTDGERLWWKPRTTKLPITICDACYCDGVFPTMFAHEFDPLHQETKKDKWFCSMGAFQLSLVWKHAVEKKDYSLWFKAASAALSPMCSSEGTMGGIWNAFRDEKLEGFDFCDRCADMYVIPLGFGNYTEKRRYTVDSRVCCGFSNQYRGEILQKLGEAADWRDFDIFQEYLAPRVSQYPCAGSKAVVRDRWWGKDDFRVCEECWKFRIRFSPLAPCVEEMRPRRLDREACGLGTDDGKRWWDVACQKRDFWGFIEAMRMKKNLQELRRGRKELEGKLDIGGRRAGFYEDRRRSELKNHLADFARAEAELTEELRALTAS